jgi:ABC transporter substrate binding protein
MAVSLWSPIHSPTRKLIVALASRHRVPAIYGQRQFPASGGLLSYGPDLVDTVGRAASYVDRILRGAKPAELPVQAPTKFEMVVKPGEKESTQAGTSDRVAYSLAEALVDGGFRLCWVGTRADVVDAGCDGESIPKVARV